MRRKPGAGDLGGSAQGTAAVTPSPAVARLMALEGATGHTGSVPTSISNAEDNLPPKDLIRPATARPEVTSRQSSVPAASSADARLFSKISSAGTNIFNRIQQQLGQQQESTPSGWAALPKAKEPPKTPLQRAKGAALHLVFLLGMLMSWGAWLLWTGGSFVFTNVHWFVRRKLLGDDKKDAGAKAQKAALGWVALPRAVKLPTAAVEGYIEHHRRSLEANPQKEYSRLGMIGLVFLGTMALASDTLLRMRGVSDGLLSLLPDARWNNIVESKLAVGEEEEDEDGVPKMFQAEAALIEGYHTLEEWVHGAAEEGEAAPATEGAGEEAPEPDGLLDRERSELRMDAQVTKLLGTAEALVKKLDLLPKAPHAEAALIEGYHTLEEWVHGAAEEGEAAPATEGAGEEAPEPDGLLDRERSELRMDAQVTKLLGTAEALVKKLDLLPKAPHAEDEGGRVYLGVGGGGGRRVVLWVRLPAWLRKSKDPIVKDFFKSTLAALSKMRNSMWIGVEVEGGWSATEEMEAAAHADIECSVQCLEWRLSVKLCCMPYRARSPLVPQPAPKGKGKVAESSEPEIPATPATVASLGAGLVSWDAGPMPGDQVATEQALALQAAGLPDPYSAMTQEEEATARAQERERWLSSQSERLFQRQQAMQEEKEEHLKFLAGLSKGKGRPSQDSALTDHKAKNKRENKKVDNLLKKVMSDKYSNTVLKEASDVKELLT